MSSEKRVPLTQMAPTGECLRGNGQGYLIGLLAAQRHMHLAALCRANLVVVAVLRDSIGIRYITAVLCDRLL